MKLHHIFSYLILCICTAIGFSSCVDDFEPGFGEVDGSIRPIKVSVAFERAVATGLGSRSDDGNSIQDISSLRMLIYDTDSALVHDLLIWDNGRKTGLYEFVTDESYSAYKADKDGMDDNDSALLSFNLRLKTGRYFIYAAANAESELSVADYSTIKGLKAVTCVWDTVDVKANSQMFGIFSLKANANAYKEDKPVTVTNTTDGLHCWLRRLASKVTVAFDGSDLYDNVQIYIESVALRDIPRQCALGIPNVAGIDPDSAKYYNYANLTVAGKQPKMLPPVNTDKVLNGVIPDGGIDKIQTVNTAIPLVPEDYYHVCNKRHPYLGMGPDAGNSDDETILDRTHAHHAKAFFFYENMQGVSPEGRSKYQDADGDGKIDNPDPVEGDLESGWKDSKAFGTYVEVTGYYRCTENDGHVSSGPITYRFMLGKDTDTDFNAERNHHYQLTLKFKGYGNEADWHIAYKHKRGIEVRSPLYISYLFNKKVMAAVRVFGTMPDNAMLRADIIECSWRAWGDASSKAFPPVAAGFDSPVCRAADGEEGGDGPWNSFLSLRTTKVVKVEIPGKEGMPSNKYSFNECWEYNKTYYEKNDKGWRTYNATPRESGYESNDGDGMYFVSTLAEDADGKPVERLFMIPLFTRAKELMTRIGFTGNNPYTEYPRKATVRLTVVEKDGTTPVAGFEPVDMEILQARRIVNPKGVCRRSGSTEPFRVTLMHLLDESKNFTEFNSDGKWYAEVLAKSDDGVISLSSTEKGSGVSNRPQTFLKRIEGESEHPVDFFINFHGKNGSAIVRVCYHDGTCEHYIFCREGYNPVDVTGTNQLWWPALNVAYFDGTKPEYTKSPLQQGSFFRLQNYTAICASNDKKYGFNQKPNGGYFDVILPNDKGKVTSKTKWTDITTSLSTAKKDDKYNVNFHGWSIAGNKERIPTGDDFYTFVSEKANDVNFPISKGYGVLYGDGASETQSSREMAYGYDRTDGANDARGMRGVFVYNINTTKHIFFPIGMTGYGHRQGYDSVDGTLRYAGRKALMTTSSGDALKDRPLFYDLYKRPGAIYWMRNYYPTVPNVMGKDFMDASRSSAFDMNYFTMSFEGYGGNDAVPSASTSHGCFIRTVFYRRPPVVD